MPIKTVCPQCGQGIAVPRKLVGKTGSCPYCHAEFTVDAHVAAPVPQPAPHPGHARGGWGNTMLKVFAGMGMGGALFVALVVLFMALGLNGLGNSGKPGSPPPETTTVVAGGAGPSEPLPADIDLAEQAEQILRANCYRCHGEGGSSSGGLNFMLDRNQLVDSGFYVLPEDAESSYLVEKMLNDMPPAGELPRPTEEDIEIIKQWINAGAPDFNEQIVRAFVSFDEVYRAIKEDLESTETRYRQYKRYLSLTHLYNALAPEDEMDTYRVALAKLLNSLSWQRPLAIPEPIDENGNILSIDLRDYDWPKEVWAKLVAASPYAFIHPSTDAQFVREQTGAEVPLLRVDWLVANASKPPLYHEALQLPDTLAELEKQLDIDLKHNIENDRAIRAGFESSGVSQNNRLIERHPFQNGAFWISYDFESNTGRQHLFSHPLGPGENEKNFKHAGGEIIFNLPNGLQGYMLVNASGKRINEGPTSIVSDPNRPDKLVVNGLSCMSCHHRGIIFKKDEIREHVEVNASAFEGELEDILALYPPASEMDRFQQEDRERFERALDELGIADVGEKGEPIVLMAKRFEASLDSKLAAAELGLAEQDFLTRLDNFPELLRVLGPLKQPGRRVKRDVFVQTFANAAESFGIGEPFVPPKEQAAPVEKPAAAAPLANLRPWSDAQGNVKFQAGFVSFDNGIVKLKKTDGTIVEEPVDGLSENDQKFVLDRPPVTEAVAAELPEERLPEDKLPPGYRIWTDYRGQTLVAKLVSFENGVAVLEGQNGKTYPVRFPLLSPPDRQFLVTNTPGQAASVFTPSKPPAEPEPKAQVEIGYRRWSPTSMPPFRAKFLSLEHGILWLKYPDGVIVSGPVNDMGLRDHEYIKRVIGEAAFAHGCKPAPGEFGDGEY